MMLLISLEEKEMTEGGEVLIEFVIIRRSAILKMEGPVPVCTSRPWMSINLTVTLPTREYNSKFDIVFSSTRTIEVEDEVISLLVSKIVDDDDEPAADPTNNRSGRLLFTVH